MINGRVLRKGLTIGWLMLCGSILWWFMSHPLAWSEAELTIGYIVIMLIITFPVGLLYWSLLSLLGLIVPSTGLDKEVELVLIWLGFVVVGYYQWFVVVPWCFEKFKGVIKSKNRGQGDSPRRMR